MPDPPILALNTEGPEVEELHVRLREIGVDIPRREVDEKSFGIGTRRAVLDLQAKHGLAETGRLDEETRLALEGAVATVRDGINRIEGQAFLDYGVPATGVVLRAYALGFGSEAKLLAEATVDEQGFYQITFERNGRSPSVEVRAVGPGDSETGLLTSAIVPSDREELDLVVPEEVQPPQAEFDMLSADMIAELGSLDHLADAREDEERHDLTLLHQATGWDARLLALAASSSKLAAETSVPVDALYAAVRVGLPRDRASLSLVDREAFAAGLEKARDAGVVRLSKAATGRAVEAFEAFAAGERPKARAAGATSSLEELLDAGTDRGARKLTGEERETFTQLYFEEGGEGEAFWAKAIRQGLPKAKVEALRVQGKLAYLTVNNAELTASLANDVGKADDLSALVELDLHEPATWKARLKKVSGRGGSGLQALIPPAYTGTPAERLNAYADDLAAKVRASFPTQVVGRMLARGDLPLSDDGDATARASSFLEKGKGLGFELGRVPAGPFAAENHEALFGAGAAEEEVSATVRAVKHLQRLYQLTPSDGAMVALAKNGFESAQDIVAFRCDAFVKHCGDQFASADEARAVYGKAEQISAVTQNVGTLAGQILTTPIIHAVSSTERQIQTVQTNLIKRFPTLESLFGSLDFCECEHCRSVLSPAAYLVDLLQFLDQGPKVWESFTEDWKRSHDNTDYPHPSPFLVLAERRPDLPHLPLTCENTLTALPYIDVVNEILEYFVAHDKLEAQAARDTGQATTPELLAEPQHILATAYDKLRQAPYPLSAPFDLSLETVRRFCEHFEAPLARVLEVFRPSDELFAPAAAAKPYYRSAILAESLGISPSEYAIFTASDPLQDWFKLYGYTSAAEATTVATGADGQRVDLHSAKSLARRLGVTYKQLVSLVRSGFVNPELEKLVVLRKLGIDVDDVYRYKRTPPSIAFSPAEEAAFEARLDALSAKFNPGGDPQGFNARTWLNDAWQDDFDKILQLADPSTGCDFDRTTLRYAGGAAADPLVFLKLNLFVRLWRKLGWTIEETDRALQALLPKDAQPLTATNLGAAMRTALVYLAHLEALNGQVKVGKDSRLHLLALWGDLATTGAKPLYAQLFLTPGALKNDLVFDDPLGNYLPENTAVLLKDHLPAVQGAVNLSAGDVALVLEDAGTKLVTAKLTLKNVSLLYRHGLLAKALKMPVRDIIVLKALTGAEPFSAPKAAPLANLFDDYPLVRTLRFVEIAQEVKRSGFKLEDLDYLLRHRFDPAGKYRTAAELPAALVRSLAAGLRRIQAEHTAPTDAAAISDDFLREKLALVFEPAVVNEFFGYWNDTAEFTAQKAGVAPAKKLDPRTFESEGVRVGYDALRQRQQAIHLGVLTDAGRDALAQATKPRNNAPQAEKDRHQLFTDLLTEIAAQSQPRPAMFFEKHFGGFLTYADLYGGALAPPTAARRQKVADSILPFVRQQLARQLVASTIAADLGADPALIDALVTNAGLIADPSATGQVKRPLLDAFTQLGPSAATAEYYASANLSGQRMATSGSAETITVPGRANSARFSGYFEVAKTGAYRFYGTFGRATANAKLTVGTEPQRTIDFDPSQGHLEVSEPGDFIELKGGVLYEFTVEARNLGGGSFGLLIQGETLPKDNLGQLVLCPRAVADGARAARLLLAKTLQLAAGFELTERELRHLTSHAADFDSLELGKLPTSRLGDSQADAAAVQKLFTQFLRLAAYAVLKRRPGGGTDDLIGVFERARVTHPVATNEEAKQAHFQPVAQLMRRDADLVRAAAKGLGFRVTVTPEGQARRVETPDLAQEQGLQRLWDALQLVEALGVPVKTVIGATGIVTATATAQRRFEIARDLRNAVKARYEPEIWQRMAQPIFDKLRAAQRDALVAYVMHKLKFARAEQLFEHFLIDPGMEPVVQTSRLRLAISSVQLFIQRCLLNLEARVEPSAIINAEHWKWMKRYRVWEANRKIFLYPENWLEPEFRDDKTHLYRELEGRLLQGDISNDLAEDAFLGYLRKLEELARLDIVAMHVEEKPDPGANVLHVIGRTYNLPRKYYYRRYAHRMWTPWEPVGADLEGDHIVAVVWRSRLHLLWLTFIEKPAPEDPSSQATLSLDMRVTKSVEKLVEIQLNWCEYMEGEWSQRSSSGFDAPATALVGPSLQANRGSIHVSTEPPGRDDAEGALLVHLGGDFEVTWDLVSGRRNINMVGLSRLTVRGPQAFRLASRNSPPEIVYGKMPQSTPQSPPYVTISALPQPTRFSGDSPLRLSLTELQSQTAGAGEDILRRGLPFPEDGFSLLPTSNSLVGSVVHEAARRSPFFYQDSRNTFFVEPSVRKVPVKDHNGFGIMWPHRNIFKTDKWKQLPVKVDIPRKPRQDPWSDPRVKHEFQGKRDWVINESIVVQYGETLITRDGKLDPAKAPDTTSLAVSPQGTVVGPSGLNDFLLAALDESHNPTETFQP